MILLPPNRSVLLSLTACGMKTTFGRNKSLRAKNIQYKKLTADDNYRLPVFSIPNKMKLKILFLSALTILIATTSMAQDLADEVDLLDRKSVV